MKPGMVACITDSSRYGGGKYPQWVEVFNMEEDARDRAADVERTNASYKCLVARSSVRVRGILCELWCVVGVWDGTSRRSSRQASLENSPAVGPTVDSEQ